MKRRWEKERIKLAGYLEKEEGCVIVNRMSTMADMEPQVVISFLSLHGYHSPDGLDGHYIKRSRSK